MEERKQTKKIKRWLCLLLSIILILGIAPGRFSMADNEEAEQESEETAEDENGEIIGQEAESNSEDPIEEPVVYTNAIRGKIWLDTKVDTDSNIYSGNGVFDVGETLVSGYTVHLFKESDLKTEIQTATTDGNGRYEFAGLEPGIYVVGVSSDIVNGTEYLLPFTTLDGTGSNNRFVTTCDEETEKYLYAYTNPITLSEASVVENIDAGMRKPMGIMPMAWNDYYNSDGLGHSASVAKNPLGGAIKLTGYGTQDDDTQWPAGIVKGGSTNNAVLGSQDHYSGGVYDGDGGLWLIPNRKNNSAAAMHVVRVNVADGTMQAFSDWPDIGVQTNYNFVGGVYDENGCIWMVPYNADSIVKIETKTDTVAGTVMGRMTAYDGWNSAVAPDGVTPDDIVLKNFAFQGGIYDGNGSIWLLPSTVGSFVKVDINTGQMTNYDLSKVGLVLEQQDYAGGVYDGEGGIWLIPHNSSDVIRFDTSDGSIARYGSSNDKWPSDFTKRERAFSGGINDSKGYMWMIPYDADKVVKVKISGSDIGTMTAYSMPSGYNAKAAAFVGGVYDGNNIWMAPFASDSIIRLDTQDGTMKSYGGEATNNQWDDLPNCNNGTYSFWSGAFDGENVWLVPMYADRVVKISPDRGIDVEVTSTAAAANTGDPIFYDAVANTDRALIEVTAKNKGTAPNNVIVGMDWFRTTTTDTEQYTTKAKFEEKYAATVDDNKSAVDYATPATSADEWTYQLKEKDATENGVTKNGIYWIRVRFNNGSDYVIKGEKIDYIFTQSEVKRTGVQKDNTSNVIYEPEVFEAKYGVAYELGSTPSDEDPVIVKTTAYNETTSSYDTVDYTTTQTYAKIRVFAKTVPGWNIDGSDYLDVDVDGIDLGTVQFEYSDTAIDVTEIYVDQNGAAIIDSSTNAAVENTTKAITYGDTYTGDGTANAAASDYICIGHYIAEGDGSFDETAITYYPHTGNINPEITNVTNEYTVYFVYTKASIKIVKTGNNGEKLEDVEFKLELLNSNGDVIRDYTDTTDEDGLLTFDKLPKGTYKLTEISSPDGYTVLREPVEDIKIPYYSTTADSTQSNYSLKNDSDEDEYYFYSLTYDITNQATMKMPLTGNAGFKLNYLMIGAGIILSAGVVAVYRKKRRQSYAISQVKEWANQLGEKKED